LSDLTHVQRIRQQMPATTAHIYLNTGTFGPLPNCAIQAMQERLQFEFTQGRLGAASWEAMSNIYQTAREHVARLLNADAGEIALTDNTGEGLNIISNGLNWREGDEVITTNHEHISALAPLYHLRERHGVVIRFADLGPVADHPAREAISQQITERTRLIVLSHVTWTTGAVVDIKSVAALGRERGIPVLVDGAQSAGAIPIDVKDLGVDFYAIPMQKWLCGPDGTGGLYVRRESMGYVTPTHVGYFSLKHEEDVEFALHDFAQRFELGGRQTASLAGQGAVLQWLYETVGQEWIYNRISSLHRYACNALASVPGLTLLTPVPGASGLIAFTLEGPPTEDVVKQLGESHNILIRNIHSMNSLRVSTGFYNTEEEIDTLVNALREIQGQ
jgi:L-cysteine/cystine lyase